MGIHAIPYESQSKIVFCPESMKFFVASDETALVAADISSGNTYEQASLGRPSLTQEAYDKIKESLAAPNVDQEQELDPGVLQRLVINVSNDCNMRCRYCYANCGVYGGDKAMMSKDTLSATLDYFFSRYSTIGVVQLFGGEPTMNLDAVVAACEYIRARNLSTKIGFVTNGSLLGERVADIVEKYELNVTVSIDIEELHDLLRPFPGGSPSLDVIKRNVHRLYERTGQPSQFELTYTKLHEERGVSIADILVQLKNEYGEIPVHVTPVCSDDPAYELSSRKAFIESVGDIFKAKANGIQIDYSILSGFEQCLKYRHKTDHLCNAGVGTIAVSTAGDIYPCFYHIDKDSYKVASVFDDREYIDRAIQSTRDRYLAHRKSETEECKDCFARTLCHGCLGANLDMTGDEFRSPEEQCDMTRKMLERLLIELVKYTRAAEVG